MKIFKAGKKENSRVSKPHGRKWNSEHAIMLIKGQPIISQ